MNDLCKSKDHSFLIACLSSSMFFPKLVRLHELSKSSYQNYVYFQQIEISFYIYCVKDTFHLKYNFIYKF